MKYLLDSGVWYRSVVQRESIPRDVRQLLSESEEKFGVSVISLWEIAKKAQIGKIVLSKELSSWLDEAVTAQLDVLPLTSQIISQAMTLIAFPNRDPADELIVATAIVYDLTLLTTDRRLRNYRHARIRYFRHLTPS